MKAFTGFRAVLALTASLFAISLVGCSNNAASSLPSGTHITPPQNAAQVAAEEQMRKQHNAQKNQ